MQCARVFRFETQTQEEDAPTHTSSAQGHRSVLQMEMFLQPVSCVTEVYCQDHLCHGLN